MNEYVEYAFVAVAGVLAITLHEAAHGYAAWALGDDTAKRMGRLSLNPLAHVDRFGTIVFPALLVIGQLATIGRVLFLFGWAKPVPVAAWKFANPRAAMLVVAGRRAADEFPAGLAVALRRDERGAVGAALAGAPMVLFALYFVLLNLGLGLGYRPAADPAAGWQAASWSGCCRSGRRWSGRSWSVVAS